MLGPRCLAHSSPIGPTLELFSESVACDRRAAEWSSDVHGDPDGRARRFLTHRSTVRSDLKPRVLLELPNWFSRVALSAALESVSTVAALSIVEPLSGDTICWDD